ncbi:hypothetical protein EON80_18490 [bacterium]|nr:MAG: hypothetical protein EON80_18490 [bacterium]
MESPFTSSSALSTPSSRPPRPKVTTLSFLGLLPALPVAVLIGIVYHFVARYLDLLVIFPVLVGVVTGGFLSALALKNKVRSVAAVAFVGVLCGLACYTSREFSDSLYARESMIGAAVKALGGNKLSQEMAIDKTFRTMYTPVGFFPLYLQSSARRGVSISSSHGGGKTPIRGWGFWALFVFEGLLITGTSAAVAASQAKQPYCEPCDDWYSAEKTVTRVHPDLGDAAVKLVESRDFAGLGALRGEGATDTMHCDVKVAQCDKCGTGNLTIVSTQDKSSKTLLESKSTSKEIETLEAARAQWL